MFLMMPLSWLGGGSSDFYSNDVIMIIVVFKG